MPESTNAEIHIASFLVHVRPESLDAVLELLEATPGLEEGTRDPMGKLVVLAEGASHQDLLNAMELIENAPGVLECILVYHEVMSPEEARQQLIATGQSETEQQEAMS
ncbi:chaperone NapD [Marinobacter shengliensis]|jgi:nitrate reductase NapD|uniref:chaperone NapD n=1 Tax=Marinobacter shengliensis TaxID=1389223 RepID=UPI00142E55B5|nr:chaperone NapD [Marinobacter shengliensis]